ncbi:hypothetical protein QQ020_32885 [Fulvivirgaceae bacterium BMA12]|uniref:Uncharacterized protein n=1 Tax=Agaribacillus aureus TaxID=3051825 RepID=A0ABT8LGJ0_9BACT|nr:hypothetical protein [Fulvivirgaceae bacterium BMA12]
MRYSPFLTFCLLFIFTNHVTSQDMPLQASAEAVSVHWIHKNPYTKSSLPSVLRQHASITSITGNMNSAPSLVSDAEASAGQNGAEPGLHVYTTGSGPAYIAFAHDLKHKIYTATDDNYKPVSRTGRTLGYSSPQDVTYKKYFHTISGFPNYAADTSEQKLRIVKKGRFIYDNQPPQKIWSGLNYSEAYNAVLQQYPEAYLESKKARYNAYGMMVGLSVVTILSAIELAKTIDDANKVNSGMLVDGGFKVGDLVPLLIASGFTLYFTVKTKKHSKKAIAIVNQGY